MNKLCGVLLGLGVGTTAVAAVPGNLPTGSNLTTSGVSIKQMALASNGNPALLGRALGDQQWALHDHGAARRPNGPGRAPPRDLETAAVLNLALGPEVPWSQRWRSRFAVYTNAASSPVVDAKRQRVDLFVSTDF